LLSGKREGVPMLLGEREGSWPPLRMIRRSPLGLKGIVSFGYLDITSPDLGKLCGLSENTVAEALDEWEDLKVLQIVPGKVTRDRTGAVVDRAPQRIMWLPGLLLDHDIIKRERERFAVHLADTRQRAKLNGWAMAGIHLDRIARNKIDKGYENKLIHTVRGFGYLLGNASALDQVGM
jgi:hypothetical protein